MLPIALIAGQARAGEPPDAAARPGSPERRLPSWSLGAGIALGGPSAGIGVPTGSDPSLSLMLERRLTRPLWLMAKAIAGYSTTDQAGATFGTTTELPPIHGTTALVGGALGVRYVFTPDAPFQFSTFTTVGASHQGSGYAPKGKTPGFEGAKYDASNNTVAAQLGIAIDRELIEGLGLRLSTIVGYAGWSKATQEVDLGPGEPKKQESEGFLGGVTLAPSIELRFSF